MTEKNFFSDKKKQFATLIAFLAGVIAALIVMWVIFTDLPNITPIFCFGLFLLVIVVMAICWVLAYIAIETTITQKKRLDDLRYILKENGVTEITLKHDDISDTPFQNQLIRSIYRNELSKIFVEYKENDILEVSMKSTSDVIFKNVGSIKLTDFDDFFKIK